MSVIEELMVRLKGDASGFKRAMDEAVAKANAGADHLRSALAKAENGGAALRASLAAAFGGIALGEVFALARAALDAAGGLGELADQIGISTDMLQVLDYASTQAGVSAGETQAAVAKLTKAIGEAADGSDAAQAAFRKWGVGLVDANGKARSTESVLFDIAERMAAARDEAQAAAIATDFFGRSGQKLIPMLKEGAAGLSDFERQAKQAGMVLSTWEISNADAAADAISRIEFQAAKLSQTLVVKAAPAVEAFLSGFADFLQGGAPADSIEGLRAELDRVNAEFDRLPERTSGNQATYEALVRRRIELALELAKAEAKAAQDAAARVGQGAGGGIPTDAKTAGVEQDLRAELEALNQTSRERFVSNALRKASKDATDAERASIAALANQLYNEKAAREAQAQGIERATQAAAAEEQQRADAAKRSRDVVLARNAIVRAINEEVAAAGLLVSQGVMTEEQRRTELQLMEWANRYRAEGIPLVGQEIDAHRELARTLVQGQMAAERQQAAQQALQDTLVQGWSGVGQSIVAAVRQGEDAFSAFGNVALSILDRVIGQLIEMAAINPMLNSLFGSALPTLGGTSGLIGGLFGGTRDSGGPGIPGKAYLIGRGAQPELFVPKGSGDFYPAGSYQAVNPPAANAAAMYVPVPVPQLGSRSAVAGSMTVNVIDQRQAGAPPIQSRQGRGPSGERLVEVIVRDEVRKGMSKGAYDGAMAVNFGLSRLPVDRG